MMLPTHALAGMALALPVAAVAPEATGIALVAGLVGGVFPDLDLYVGHRRTLHFPVYYTLLAAIAVPLAFVSPTTLTIVVAAWALAAAAHCLADVFGGGLELRPWEATADRAVYDHFNGRWIAPKRWVRYDGAPEDLAASLVLAAALWGPVDGPLRTVVAAALVVAVVYAALRRVLPTVAERLVGVLPAHLVGYLPARYLEAGEHATSVSHDSQ
ncbi:metal-dependent hydrolase [Halobaculum limi]|uniref:metal-dependent hydrolase n=1 Tax=Halobaculum limi TaxID=3031916 RepID=UPI00240704E8|nr:metal-dependent hydrolase [Halobaculum sp. YSMS11]